MLLMLLISCLSTYFTYCIFSAAWLDKCDSKIIYERRMQAQVLYVVPITSILGTSGTCRKFRPVICLVHACHMTSQFICLSYIYYMTRIYFPTKLILLSYRVGIWHPSKLTIHTMSLYIRGDYFLKSYTVLKTAVVYDKYKPNICLAYAKIFVFFNQLRFD
jgi:hypothetical protein